MIEDAIEWWMGNRFTAMPATVVSYDFDNQSVDVTPDIDAIDQEGNTYKRPTIAAVPVVFPCSPTSAITFPLPAGSKVLLVWSMRSVDNWKQNGSGTPSDYRMFDIRDAYAIAGAYPRNQTKTRAGQSADDLVLVHNIGGSQCEFHLKASGDILAKTPTTFNVQCKDFVVDATHTQINSPVNTSSTIVAAGDVTGQGTSLHSHTHPGVQAGGSNTGAPN